MAMIRCPVCGEKYSDTYRHCPFCEEDEALRQGEQIRRNVSRGGRRSARRQQPSLLSPLLILLILILAALLVYLLFGDKLAQSLFGESASQQVEETLDGQGDDVTMPEVDGVEDPDQETGTETTDPTQVDPATLPETLTIAYLGSPREEFTMTVGDDPIPLTASGGTGTYAWSSSDDGIASVDAEGKVTAISAGQATLTVTDGTGKGTCEVIVKAGASNGTSSGGSSTGTSTGTSAGTLKAGEQRKLAVKPVAARLGPAGVRRGGFSIRRPDGLSRPVLIYVRNDREEVVPPETRPVAVFRRDRHAAFTAGRWEFELAEPQECYVVTRLGAMPERMGEVTIRLDGVERKIRLRTRELYNYPMVAKGGYAFLARPEKIRLEAGRHTLELRADTPVRLEWVAVTPNPWPLFTRFQR